VIERGYAEQLDMSEDDVRLLQEVNADEGVQWLFSFLSADRRRSYCLYEAPSPEPLLAAARRVGILADVITEVERVSPDALV
jgi:Nickel responsive protein SCO4226-like